MTSGKPVCLATAATECFVPGTLVLIDSFLRRHPRFDGEIVVIHDGLSEEARAVLAATSDAVRFAPVPPALRERAEVTAFRLWHEAYVEALTNARVRTAARGWAGWTLA